jgi:NADPH:quinone reductase
VNPVDQKHRDLNVVNIALPAVIGADLVGTVVKNGPNTSSFPVGSHVLSQSISFSAAGLQEYAIIDARYAAIVPAGISDEDAAVFPINGFTSTLSLFHPEKGLGIPFPGTPESKTFDYKSQKLVIIGGGTNCGKLAIQLARIAGIGTVITTASFCGEAELKGYGATHVIDRQASNIEEQVRSIVGDDLVYVYDTFHIEDHSLAVSLLSNSKKGSYAHLIYGKPSDAVAAQKKAGYEAKHIMGASAATPDLAILFWKQFPKWLQSGEIKPLKYSIIEGLNAEKVNVALDGYKDLASGKRYHVRF